MTIASAERDELLDFWRKAGFPGWFGKDADFDHAFTSRFADLHGKAVAGDLDGWKDSREGALALLILLDQYPRNAFRGTPRAFEHDPQALALAKEFIDKGYDVETDEDLRVFFYLPLEHSEDLADQERSVELCTALSDKVLDYAMEHRDIIRRFGRFPHRNPILGRESTPEELAYIEAGGFAG